MAGEPGCLQHALLISSYIYILIQSYTLNSHQVRHLTGGSFPRKIHDMRKLDQLVSGAAKFHDGPDTIRHFQFSGDL